MKKVLIIQRRMTHYRIPFFNLLLNELLSRNISLIVAAGEGHISEQLKSDKGVLDWAHPLRTHYFFDGKICWQPFGSVMNGCYSGTYIHSFFLSLNVLLCGVMVQIYKEILRHCESALRKKLQGVQTGGLATLI